MRLKTEKQHSVSGDVETVWNIVTGRTDRGFIGALPPGLAAGDCWSIRPEDSVSCVLEDFEELRTFSISFESRIYLGVWKVALESGKEGGTEVFLSAGVFVKNVDPFSAANAFLKVQKFQEAYLAALKAAAEE